MATVPDGFIKVTNGCAKAATNNMAPGTFVKVKGGIRRGTYVPPYMLAFTCDWGVDGHLVTWRAKAFEVLSHYADEDTRNRMHRRGLELFTAYAGDADAWADVVLPSPNYSDLIESISLLRQRWRAVKKATKVFVKYQDAGQDKLPWR
jgi:hypothetical protein